MATFRELLASAKTQINEVDTAAAADAIAAGAVVLDVREPDEFDQGALQGVVHIPRGHLEAQVEGRLLDKTAPVVVYCAGGVRSAFAAQTLQQLGYENVVSPMGTALTEDQLRLLKRYSRRIVLALDPDAAGQKAVLRGLEAARNAIGKTLGAAQALALGLVTATPDDIDWDDDIRMLVQERASFSPDALTAMEANLRFAGPETMETRIFARLTAWQNWVFQRPNAVGETGSLKRYGSGIRPDYDIERV